MIFKSKSGLADTTGPPQSVDYEILPIPVLRRLLLANNKLTTLSGQVCIQHVSFRSFQVLGTRPLHRWADSSWTVEPKINWPGQFRNPKSELNPKFPRKQIATEEYDAEQSRGAAGGKRAAALSSKSKKGNAKTPNNAPGTAVSASSMSKSVVSGSSISRSPSVAEYSLLQSIEYLNADYNKLAMIPDSITALTGLTELSIQHNLVDELPQGMYVLSQLRRLNVAYNKITRLPLDFGLMRTTLRRLDLEGNTIILPPTEISDQVKTIRPEP